LIEVAAAVEATRLRDRLPSNSGLIAQECAQRVNMLEALFRPNWDPVAIASALLLPRSGVT